MRKAICAAALTLVLALSAGSMAAAGSDKTQTASGNVAKVNAAERSVMVSLANDSQELRFVWTNETKINGTLAVGAKVTVRYTTLPDGQNVAHQISVARN